MIHSEEITWDVMVTTGLAPRIWIVLLSELRYLSSSTLLHTRQYLIGGTYALNAITEFLRKNLIGKLLPQESVAKLCIEITIVCVVNCSFLRPLTKYHV